MEIKANTLDAYHLLHKGTQAFSRAEKQGFRIDTKYIEKKKIKINKKITFLEKKIEKSTFYKDWKNKSKSIPNLASPAQLQWYLYEELGLRPPKKTPSGRGSTDEESLKELKIPELDWYLEIKKLKKVRDTYLESFLRETVNGVIHPFYNLHTVRTYRSSSDRPNFQNIPKRDKETMNLIRRAIYPRRGHQLMEVDYGSLEVRIAACYHKDPVMMKYLKDPESDMHGDMAKDIFLLDKMDTNIPELKLLRSAAKNGFVFPQFYGDYYKNNALSLVCNWGGLPHGKWKAGQGVDMPGGKTLADHLISKGIKELGRDSRSGQTGFIKHIKDIENHFWNRRFKVYGRWKEKWYAEYQRKGYIDMLTGFRCIGVMGKNDIINYPVQGAAFHCLLWAFIELDEILKPFNTKLIGQIHDAIILDVDPAELEEVSRLVVWVMTVKIKKEWSWIVAPLEVDAELCPVDRSWAEKQDYELPEV